MSFLTPFPVPAPSWVLCEHSDFRGRQWLLDVTEITNWLTYSGLQHVGSLYPIRQVSAKPLPGLVEQVSTPAGPCVCRALCRGSLRRGPGASFYLESLKVPGPFLETL